MIMFVMAKYIGLRRGMMRICESISPSARKLWWFEEGMLIGCVRQKGICELWRAVALYRGAL